MELCSLDSRGSLGFYEKNINLAMNFLNTGKCSAKNAFETANHFNLIRDAFSQITPSNTVYDKNNRSIEAPWSSNLSGIDTACGNLYTTSDGKDLLFEVVSILTYAYYMEVDVICQGWTDN
ncbi:Imm70 family immunity protein [Proteiniclasticum ruminis]|uniref:Immunity protein 70 n=1 Tax=Proteiniclasticum ruminis TaxID=398199 RepID=A0A1G8RHA0_9CLOT|nr:Imm70 family immunity protein [Proteiniclasticum ruminis]SDJ15875.1 Immunity protein 70 [Proteiniclasticum ruminis]